MIRKDIPADLMIEILVGAIDAIVNPHEAGRTRADAAKTGFTHIITIFLEGVLVREGGTKR